MDVKPKLLDQVRQKIRFKHYSIRTEQAYVEWIRRYILVSSEATPTRYGKNRGRTVSHAPCRGTQRRGINPKSGAERHPVPLQRNPGTGYRLAGRHGTR
jgi:hypothetical protein